MVTVGSFHCTMGRKKKKSAEEASNAESHVATLAPTDPRKSRNIAASPIVPHLEPPQPPQGASSVDTSIISAIEHEEGYEDSFAAVGGEDVSTKANDNAYSKETPLPKSGYAMTTHSAEIIDEDIYVSEGSDMENDEDALEDSEDSAMKNVEILLAGSRMGIMRRGIHHPMLLAQPNRQWVKDSKLNNTNGTTGTGSGTERGDAASNPHDETERQRLEEEELAKLDPAQRAARLLAEKQRKLEEAKELARRVESEENAGRDPCLFSKRTAFDIRFDQIDDKPWTRGGDFTEFFNYGLTEEDWLEYSQQQLMIRQELTDASRQRRPPDPTIVPVAPRTPSKQTPKVAVATSGEVNGNGGSAAVDSGGNETQLGPVLVKKEDTTGGSAQVESFKEGQGPSKLAKPVDVPAVIGGAWGAGAAPDSTLAKLIAEQEMQEGQSSNADATNRVSPPESKYGPGAGGDHKHLRHEDTRNDRSRNSEPMYNRSSGPPGPPQPDRSHNNSYGPAGGHPYEVDSHHSPPLPPPQHWDAFGGVGHRGSGRGFPGGRGEGGKGGRGSFRDRSFPGRSGRNSFHDGGDFPRKRPRDGGGWRR